MKDTIAAISTPHGYGGIGVIRISGTGSLLIVKKIFRPSKKIFPPKTAQKQFTPRKLYHGHILSSDTEKAIDEVLMAFMPAPNSYTGEDVVEIQAHAGTIVLRKILEIVISEGARLAEPGEFTRRAFVSGRIDMSQAEAVMDVIQAKTDRSLTIAERNLEGEIGKTARELKKRLLDINAMVEAQVEFPEDIEDDDGIIGDIIEKSKGIKTTLNEIISVYKMGNILRNGLKLVIVGRTNVGKSSLLNQFLKRERAIVTEHPGTTRDSIEEIINIEGLPVVLIDTAGLRKTKDPVEKIGIERARKHSDDADLILFVIDAGEGVVPEDLKVYQEIRDKKIILIINKIDLNKNSRDLKLPEEWKFLERCLISIKKKTGIEELQNKIFEIGTDGLKDRDDLIVPNMRQNILFKGAYSAITEAETAIKEGMTIDIIALDLKEAMDRMDEITGEIVKTDVMDTVFSQFCIGK